MAVLIPFNGHQPQVGEGAFVAPTASVIGDVTLGEGVGIYYGAVLRGDSSTITVGAGSNVQDNAVLHADPDFPAHVGSGVSIGHGAVVHGCTVEDDCLIGMNATVLNGAVIGSGSLVAAGAVVLEGTVVPPGSLVAGVPGKVRRELTEDERDGIRRNAENYRALTGGHREAQA
jgi:carbonic anhydrase/acetyltransferase-like protein (isoleucine patch superfamily)